MSRSATPSHSATPVVASPGPMMATSPQTTSRSTPAQASSRQEEGSRSPRVPSPRRAHASSSGPKTEDGVVDGEDDKSSYEYVSCTQRRERRDKIRYTMQIVQQPEHARMCGVGEKPDRRPIDPTPIVQLTVTDENDDDIAALPSTSQRPPTTYLQNPNYFLWACLVAGDDERNREIHLVDDGKTRFLTGNPVSSMYHLKDPKNRDAAYFVFPDLGVRKEGLYKIKLSLFEIVDQQAYFCATTYTQTFPVQPAKQFEGMKDITPLQRSLADQGLKLRVRKDARPAGRKNKRKSEQSEDEASKRSRPTHPPYGQEYYRMPPPPPPMAYEDGRPLSSPQSYARPHRHSYPAGYYPEHGRPNSAGYAADGYRPPYRSPPRTAGPAPAPHAAPHHAYPPPHAYTHPSYHPHAPPPPHGAHYAQPPHAPYAPPPHSAYAPREPPYAADPRKRAREPDYYDSRAAARPTHDPHGLPQPQYHYPPPPARLYQPPREVDYASRPDGRGDRHPDRPELPPVHTDRRGLPPPPPPQAQSPASTHSARDQRDDSRPLSGVSQGRVPDGKRASPVQETRPTRRMGLGDLLG